MSRNLNKCFHKNDELYTPRILVEAILEYIPKNKTIWCPFDTEKSEFVKVLKENNFNVIFSHIWNNQDFFEYTPKEKYDLIISNPPFSKKIDVFNRLYELDKPFAMLMNLEVLNYQIIGDLFYNNQKQLQLLIPNKKVSFNGNTSSFNTSYFCYNLLPRDIIFCNLKHNNTGFNFVPSEMYNEIEYIGVTNNEN